MGYERKNTFYAVKAALRFLIAVSQQAGPTSGRATSMVKTAATNYQFYANNDAFT